MASFNPALVSALLGSQTAPSSAAAVGMGGAGILAAFPFLAGGAAMQQRQQQVPQTQSTRVPLSSQDFQSQNQRFNLAGMDIPSLQAYRRSLQDQGRLTPEASTAIFNAVQAQAGGR